MGEEGQRRGQAPGKPYGRGGGYGFKKDIRYGLWLHVADDYGGEQNSR